MVYIQDAAGSKNLIIGKSVGDKKFEIWDLQARRILYILYTYILK